MSYYNKDDEREISPKEFLGASKPNFEVVRGDVKCTINYNHDIWYTILYFKPTGTFLGSTPKLVLLVTINFFNKLWKKKRWSTH